MKDSNSIWLLMAKKIAGSILCEEKDELDELLAVDPELWYAFELLEAAISLEDIPQDFILEIQSLLSHSAETTKLQTLIGNQMESQQAEITVATSRKKLYLIPVLLTVVVVITIWLGNIIIGKSKLKNESLAMNEIVAPKGSKTQITLADGTQIWLNAGSRLRYSKNFSLEKREVFLSGEAYFKVVHNEKHSFLVHTPDADIKDLGTTFNVKAFGGIMEATLIEGALEVVLRNKSTRTILLKPHEKVVLRNSKLRAEETNDTHSEPDIEITKLIPYRNTDEIIETAWMSDKLIFRNQRFGDIIKDMERRYNVIIELNDPNLKDSRLTGIFQNESVTKALELLQVIEPFKYTLKNDGKILIEK